MLAGVLPDGEIRLICSFILFLTYVFRYFFIEANKFPFPIRQLLYQELTPRIGLRYLAVKGDLHKNWNMFLLGIFCDLGITQI